MQTDMCLEFLSAARVPYTFNLFNSHYGLEARDYWAHLKMGKLRPGVSYLNSYKLT